MRFNTALLHGDFRGDKNTGATQTPIYQSSAFEHASAETLEKIFNNMAPGFSYSRISNPTIEAFEKRMTVLEGGVASVACSSGMAAITNAFTNILQSGDEIVCSASLYGGSIDLFRDLESFGIKTHYVNNNDVEQFRAATNENTRLYFAETIGNPRLDVTDIRLIADEAHRAGVPFIVDNTVATAYLIKPIEYGADIVVNSTSKYVNGNSNSISGVITDSGNFKWDIIKYPGMKDFKKYGPYAYTAKLRNGIYRNLAVYAYGPYFLKSFIPGYFIISHLKLPESVMTPLIELLLPLTYFDVELTTDIRTILYWLNKICCSNCVINDKWNACPMSFRQLLI